MQEIMILKHFMLARAIQYKYYQNIKKVDNLQKEYQMLFARIDELYQLFPDKGSITPDELKTYLLYKMPSYRDMDFLAGLIDTAQEADVGEGVTELVLTQLAERHIASKIVATLTPVLENAKFEQIPKVADLVQDYNDLAGAMVSDHRLSSCDLSIKELVAEKQSQTGLSWPLTKLQDAMGDAEYGKSGVVFARPETGKTSFGITLAAHWAGCMINDPKWVGLYFGCEEGIEVHKLRFTQSILGCREEHLFQAPDRAQSEALKRGFDKFKFFGSVVSTRDIEQLLKMYRPKVIVIDQTPKIYKPGQPESEVQRLGQIFLWVRQHAKDDDLLAINLMQAAATAENKQWLSQTDMHNSKTDVAGETDWAIGIGMVNEPGMEYQRFLSLCRNKGGPHARFQSYFDFNRCKYYDKAPVRKGAGNAKTKTP